MFNPISKIDCKILIVFWIVGFVLFTPFQAYSQSDKTLKDATHLADAIIQQSIDVTDVEPKSFKSTSEELLYLRSKIFRAFDRTNSENLKALVDEHQVIASRLNDVPELALNDLYNDIANFYNPNMPLENYALLVGKLEKYVESKHWLVAHTSVSFKSYLHSFNRQNSVALSQASNSLGIIPDDKSLEAIHAKLVTYEMMSYFYNLLGNTSLALETTELLIETAATINWPLDGTQLLSNLIYSFDLTQNTAVLQILTEKLLALEKVQTSQMPGIAEMRAAMVSVRSGHYTIAMNRANEGLSKATNPLIIRNLQLHRIQALAGNNQTTAAQSQLEQLLINYPDAKNSSFIQREILRTEGLIAAGNGNARLTYEKMQRYNDLSVHRILKSNNSDTASLLANLENDKVRQQEREALLAMEQENRRRMWTATLIIMALLLAAAISVAVFAAYRSRTAHKLAKAAEAALAGEKAKSQFLAVISHELRTPLNGIIGIADLLSRTAPTEDLRRKISIVNDSGHDLLKLVEQVLDMSRIDANEMEIFPEYTPLDNIIESLDGLWRPTIESKGVIFTTHLDSSVPSRIKVDPMRLRQCINNLISNASKFTHKGRIHMHVSATLVDGTEDIILSVIVADTGIGMSEEVAGNLFRPFVQADSSITRQYGGSGLGLAITRSLARMMDGDLTVITRKDAGTEFTLTLKALAAHDADIMETVDAAFDDIDHGGPSTVSPALAISPAHTDVPAETDSNDIDIVIQGISNDHSNNPTYQPSKDVELDRVLGGFPDTRLSDPDPFSEPQKENDGPDNSFVDISAALHTAHNKAEGSTRDIAIQAPTRSQAAMSSTSLPQTIDEANMDNLENLRVLIVEDVPSNYDVIKIFLDPQGCLVMGAENGAVAVAAAAKQEFDVILMDIRMPEMDGIEATKAIRTRGGLNAHVPIIALTADATAETNAECMAAGADIFLTKPLIATELYDAMRFVRRQALRRAIRAGAVKPSPIIRVEDDRRSA